jgi:hypothetical protein
MMTLYIKENHTLVTQSGYVRVSYYPSLLCSQPIHSCEVFLLVLNILTLQNVGHVPRRMGLADSPCTGADKWHGPEHAARLHRGASFTYVRPCMIRADGTRAYQGGWLPMWKNIVGRKHLDFNIIPVLIRSGCRNEYHGVLQVPHSK